MIELALAFRGSGYLTINRQNAKENDASLLRERERERERERKRKRKKEKEKEKEREREMS